jgi:3-oxoacyl-(acyl-carrier-protein) synthase
MVAGGVDELCAPVYRRLAEMGVLSPMGRPTPEGCRPFSRDHNGPVLGEGATFVMLEERSAAIARGATIHAEVLGTASSNIPAAPYSAPRGRKDGSSPVRRVLSELGLAPESLSACYGSGNGDPPLDDWETALLDADLASGGTGSGDRSRLAPRSLASLFGQHGGLGALRVGAAALGLAKAGAGPTLVHGIARGGCRTAIVLGRAA